MLIPSPDKGEQAKTIQFRTPIFAVERSNVRFISGTFIHCSISCLLHETNNGTFVNCSDWIILTYAVLLSVPHTCSSNRYNQYHYGIASYLHQSPQYASSSDYETHLPSHSNRDVRVPLKEQINDDINNYDHDDSDDDDYNHSRLSSSPSRRSTNLGSSSALSLYDYSPLTNTSREYSLIHSHQPTSNSIHQRSLNDDLNAITQFSAETGNNILRNITESSNSILTKTRSSSVLTNKPVTFIDQDDDDEENYNYNKSSKMIYKSEFISFSSIR